MCGYRTPPPILLKLSDFQESKSLAWMACKTIVHSYRFVDVPVDILDLMRNHLGDGMYKMFGRWLLAHIEAEFDVEEQEDGSVVHNSRAKVPEIGIDVGHEKWLRKYLNQFL